MDSPFDAKTVAELRRPLDPDSISTLRDGPAAGTHYLEAVIVEYAANRIFGPGNWAFRLVGQPWRETEEKRDGTPQIVWCALGELEVRGALVFRDLGTNQQSGPGAPAMEMSIKGAVTDAMKRCLKHYGDQFGLVLYDKAISMQQMQAEFAAFEETCAKKKAERAPTPPMQPDPPAEMTTPPAPALIAAPTPAAQRQPPFGFHFKDGELVPDEEPGDEELPLREQLRRANVTLGDVAKAIDFAVAGRTQAEIEMALRVYLKQNPDVTLRQVLGEAAHRKGRQPVGARSN